MSDSLRNFPTGTTLAYGPNLKLMGDDGDKPGDVPAFLFARDADLKPVAKSGQYGDLQGKPDLTLLAQHTTQIAALLARIEALESRVTALEAS